MLLDINWQIISKVSEISSVLGLIVSVIVAFYGFMIDRKIKNFEKQVLFKNRVYPLLQDLKDCSSSISNYASTYETSTNELHVELTKVRAILNNMLNKIDSGHKSEAKKVIKETSNLANSLYETKFLFINRKKANKDDVWKCYSSLSEFITRIDNLIKDKKLY